MAWYNNNYAQQGGVMQSKYHSAFQKIDRLSELWNKTDVHWRNGRVREMNHELENIWKEFYADAQKPERRFWIRISRLIRKSFNRARIISNTNEKIRYMNLAAKLVITKRNFLTVVEKNQGLGKKYQEEDEDVF